LGHSRQVRGCSFELGSGMTNFLGKVAETMQKFAFAVLGLFVSTALWGQTSPAPKYWPYRLTLSADHLTKLLGTSEGLQSNPFPADQVFTEVEIKFEDNDPEVQQLVARFLNDLSAIKSRRSSGIPANTGSSTLSPSPASGGTGGVGLPADRNPTGGQLNNPGTGTGFPEFSTPPPRSSGDSPNNPAGGGTGTNPARSTLGDPNAFSGAAARPKLATILRRLIAMRPH
jgi:hypothetical protein